MLNQQGPAIEFGTSQSGYVNPFWWLWVLTLPCLLVSSCGHYKTLFSSANDELNLPLPRQSQFQTRLLVPLNSLHTRKSSFTSPRQPEIDANEDEDALAMQPDGLFLNCTPLQWSSGFNNALATTFGRDCAKLCSTVMNLSLFWDHVK